MTRSDFVTFVNDLYFDGYAESLEINNPEKYAWELAEFERNYA